jgi:hypothetical protein
MLVGALAPPGDPDGLAGSRRFVVLVHPDRLATDAGT